MSVLDGDYAGIEPTVEDLNAIETDPELVNLFDEDEYEISTNGIEDFNKYVYAYYAGDSYEDCDLSYNYERDVWQDEH